VSICLPVYNGGDLIVRALDSALEQDYDRIEVVVVDDLSSDGTPHLIRELYGDRVSLSVNPKRMGASRNHSAAVLRSRGEFVKFLNHDDVLSPTCVSRMVDALVTRSQAGMVFCRRTVELATDDAAGAAWADAYGELHSNFSDLGPINDGSVLFSEWLSRGFPDNWIGEPVTVMVRRNALKVVGLFNRYTRLLLDMDMWARIMAHCDVGFIDEKLVTYRHSQSSLTGQVLEKNSRWLDRLWILEALTSYPELIARHPELLGMRRSERRMAFRTVALAYLRIRKFPVPLGMWWSHLGYRLRGWLVRDEAPFVRRPVL
jgi:glycosyltransferase involved in cell wall biosynthesis